jgi:glucose/arabinose dehydrogenase/mono/diheme cytochrome c family protein
MLIVRPASLFALFALLCSFSSGDLRGDEFVCRFAEGEIKIDGQADEPAWQRAQVIDRFTAPWKKENPPARTATRARLLWDRDYLYFFAEMDDADLYADITEHDGETWLNDVFELFFKPADDKPGYYEFQVNPAGTVMDMFLPRRNAGGYKRFIADGDFHIEAKVKLRGTLNDWSDRDEGWSVEGRIPWQDFIRTGGRPAVDEKWKVALCRYDYSVDFEGPELSTCAPLSTKPHPDFHYFEDYATIRFAGPEKIGQAPAEGMERFVAMRDAMPTVKPRLAGSPEPPPPYQAKRIRPELKPSFPIFVIREPGSERLWLIDQKWSYGPARICRTTEQSGELETVLEFPDGGVGYSLEFHPEFQENGYLYVGWNGAPGGGEKRSIVSRYTIDRKTHRIVEGSDVTILEWPSDGHNGAAIAFGLDGMLYITSGDGTSDSDTNLTGQGLDHLLAKVLRIDVDNHDPDTTYSVPKDNPFIGQKGVRPETWAYGLRNPWRMAVDQKTGDVWVGNNGQDLWEQAYLIEKGANYGWSVYEGSHIFYANRELGPTPVSKPTLEHPHSEARSLTGGIVYHGDKLPELNGAYIYGDYSTGKIWAAKVEEGNVAWHREIADTTLQITSFAVDADGSLLVSDHRAGGEGGLYTLVPNESTFRPEDFPRKLSETGLFDSVAGHRIHPGLIPFSVNAPLWSDGAYKERYLYLPASMADDGSPQITPFDFTADDRGWNLPEGTISVKSFALELRPGDADSRRWIETRLFTKQNGEWVGYSYRWNQEQTEAFLVDAGGADEPFELAGGQTQTWHYPSRTECMVCHSRAANFALALSTPQMNREHDFGGVAVSQLELLEWLGALRVANPLEPHPAIRETQKTAGKSDKEVEEYVKRATATRDQRAAPKSSLFFKSVSDYPSMVDPYDDSHDLTRRAKSYLHSNCAQCHVEAGGGNAQMQLAWSTPLDKMNVLDAVPLHHKFERPDARIVAPGEPERSVLLHRMAIRERGQMPQLATSAVDEKAVRLMHDWIRSLQKSPSDKK